MFGLTTKTQGILTEFGKDLKTEMSPLCLGIGSYVMAWAGKMFLHLKSCI